MSGLAIKVPARSRKEIREITETLHRAIGFTEPPFPIVDFVEFILPQAIDGFVFGVLDMHEMGADEHGRTYPSEKAIYLRTDIYERAVNGQGRDRLTLAHEVGHLFLHATGMHREMPSENIRPFEDSEWQANCFGGELLVPSRFLQRAESPEHVADVCQVSLDAANYAWRKNRK